MICLYYNIYTAAKRVVEAEQRALNGIQVTDHEIGAHMMINGDTDSNADEDDNENTSHGKLRPTSIAQLLTTSFGKSKFSAWRSNLLVRERKASVTLGVIMSAFTICWLPFFIIALLRPFSETVNNLPRTFVLFTVWLGYSNSLLNPIIYVTFHHDFRNAFKHLLCLRCMTINEHIRKDEYKSQFGETHYQENIRKMRNQQQQVRQQDQQLLGKKAAHQLP